MGESIIIRQQIRGINSKILAKDIIYEGARLDTFIGIVADVLQNNGLTGDVTVLDLKEELISDEISDKIQMIKPDECILQVNSRVYADNDKVKIIKELKEIGYKIITIINKEDTIFTLAKIFSDYIKINIEDIADISVQGFSCKRIAYNVNKAEDYALAEASGIEYYEGSYISIGETIEIKSSQHSEVNFIMVIRMISEERNINEIGKVVAQDSLISARIIRLANSVAFGGNNIDSVDKAIVRVGLSKLKKLIYLLQFSRNSKVPEELLQTSYHRAVFCERITKKSKILTIKDSEAYMIGLFSTLEALTGHPVSEEIASMGLSEAVEEALVYRDGDGGKLLNLIRAYEDGNIKRIKSGIAGIGVNESEFNKIYVDTIEEVANLWKMMTNIGGK